MAGKPTPDGRRVHMNVKFSESEAAEIDKACDGRERGAWLREAALMVARGIPESPAPVKRTREKRGGQVSPAKAPTLPVSERLPKPTPVAVADVRAPAGTAVFRDQGGEPVVTSPVPERPARTVTEAQQQLDQAVAAKAGSVVSADDCRHPVGLRIGDFCGGCHRTVGKKKS